MKKQKINKKGAHKRNERRNRWGCKREREREREPQFNEINIKENRGFFASICDREKDRKQTDCINQEDVKVFEHNAIAV